jgi:hypothetical protein
VPVEASTSAEVEPVAAMEVDTPDTPTKEENAESAEDEMEVEEVKIIGESAPTEAEKTEPESDSAPKEEVIFDCVMLMIFADRFYSRWLSRRSRSRLPQTCPRRHRRKRQLRRNENRSWKSRLMTITNLVRSTL